MTFGYLYDFRNPEQWRQPWADFYAESLEFISWTESLGFQGAWVPEHHGGSDGYLQSPLVALAAIAARTKTIKIGTAIALAPLHHPVRFAEDCALVDILSNGRLEIALAVGYRRRETEALGVDFTSRGTRTDEFIQIVRKLWAGETVTHESKHFTIKNAAIVPRPIQNHVPIYIGGFSPKALERAAKYGDAYQGVLDAYEPYLDQVRACGKDAATARFRAQGTFFAVAKDPREAMEDLAPYFHYMNNAYAEWMSEDQGAFGKEDLLLKPVTLEEFKASGQLQIMTPEEAITDLEKMLFRVPLEHFMMFVPPGMPLSKFAKYAELFAKEVIPAFY